MLGKVSCSPSGIKGSLDLQIERLAYFWGQYDGLNMEHMMFLDQFSILQNVFQIELVNLALNLLFFPPRVHSMVNLDETTLYTGTEYGA